MIVCALMPRFPLVIAAGGREALAAGPVALAPEPGREPVIGEVSAAAEAQGVRPGLRLGEALARCPALRLVAPDVFLDQPFRIDGGGDNSFDYNAPGLGMIEIRAVRGDCKAKIAKKDLGFGPWRPVPAAAGDYRVDLICPDGQNPLNQVTVTQGRTARVNFTK